MQSPVSSATQTSSVPLTQPPNLLYDLHQLTPMFSIQNFTQSNIPRSSTPQPQKSSPFQCIPETATLSHHEPVHSTPAKI